MLLKNEGNILPLDNKKIHSLAVVGVNAADCVFGDYSGIPASNPISVLEGIKTLAGKDIEVKYAPWKSARADEEVVAPEFFPEGLTAEYFDSDNMEGTPTVRKEEWINFEPSNQAPDPFVPTAPYCIRWTGKLRPPVTGNYVIRFEAERGGRLYLDGQKVTDVWESHHD